MFGYRSTKTLERVQIVQHLSGNVAIIHNGMETCVAYDEPENEYWRGNGRWRITSSEEFPQTVGQLYTGVTGPIIRITALILGEQKE